MARTGINYVFSLAVPEDLRSEVAFAIHALVGGLVKEWGCTVAEGHEAVHRLSDVEYKWFRNDLEARLKWQGLAESRGVSS